MTTAARLLPLVLAAAAPAQAPASRASGPERVAYELTFGPGRTTAAIAMQITGLARDEVTVAMPAWKPGSYELVDCARQVANLEARAGDAQLPVARREPSRWTIRCAGHGELTVRYDLKVVRNGLGMAERVETDAGWEKRHPAWMFEGPATWLYVDGALGVPHSVRFVLPAAWQVATGLAQLAERTWGAADYDTFADCPVHVGTFERLEFTAGGVPHEIVLSGFERDDADRKELVQRWQRMVEAQLAMMGPPPYARYVFLVSFPGGAGLEHLNSTNMSMMELAGSRPGFNSAWDGLASHEFFHLWNVKRLRPKALGPFDYQAPNRTRWLWFAEGVTSYYGDLLLVRAGVWSEHLYWTQNIAREINALQRNPGRLRMSVADASWTVWDAPYMRRGFSAPDYYNKGQLLGLLLDVAIRDATDGGRSLDDVLRALYAQCVETGRGFEDGDVRRHCEEVAGRSFERFFADYVDGTEELPFRETLAKIGLRLSTLAAEAEDVAGEPESRPTSRRRPRGRELVLGFDPEAGERAVRLRKGMTARTRP
jgi:predicted metalloprotease with PDZ domain